MVPKDSALAITVFTEDTLDLILEKRGSGSWVVNPTKAGRCKYLVCCRKESWKNRNEGAEARAAFLIGLVAGLQKWPGSENERGQPRFLIEISHYARLDEPNVWNGRMRNPVAYLPLEKLGIDLKGIKFEPLPAAPELRAVAASKGKMSIAEAKKALAASFGVTPEDVEIIIRG